MKRRKKRNDIIYSLLLVIGVSGLGFLIASLFIETPIFNDLLWLYSFLFSLSILLIGIALFGFSKKINAISESKSTLRKITKLLSKMKSKYDVGDDPYDFFAASKCEVLVRRATYNIENIYKKTEIFDLKTRNEKLTELLSYFKELDESVFEDDVFNEHIINIGELKKILLTL
ncbi:MAG: hypothetical protein K5765_04400 [Clostridia bacterium]|nr:hypothetical protein [Clostridia bacterium]